MTRLWLVILVLLMGARSSVAGTVQTLEGAFHEGALTCDRDGMLRITPRAGEAVLVGLDHLLAAEFVPDGGHGRNPNLSRFSARINFQPAGTPPAEGYLPDRGEVFGPRAGGLSYGWSGDNTRRIHRGRKTADRRLGGYAMMNDQQWEIAVPNGSYSVHVVAGSLHSPAQGPYRLNVEDSLLLDGKPTVEDPFVDGTTTVTVRDGRLTLSRAAGSKVNPLCYVEITALAEIVPAAAPGAMLRCGVVIGGATITGLNDHAVTLVHAGQTRSLPSADVVRLVFRPLSSEALAKIPSHRPGVLLARGDFFEGEVRSLSAGRIDVDSVLFGPASFAVGAEAVAVSLHDLDEQQSEETAQARYTVRTADGSVYLAKSLRLDPGQVALDDIALGRLTLRLGDLVSLRYIGPRLQPLIGRVPVSVQPATRPSAPGALRLPKVLDAAGGLTLGGSPFNQALPVAAGAACTYTIGGQYKTFICRAGVPNEIVPAGRVQLIVRGDGVTLFTSAPCTSVQDPLNLAIDIRGVKTLMLAVESADSQPLGALGLFADPVLVK